MRSTIIKRRSPQRLLRHAAVLGTLWLLAYPSLPYAQQASAPILSAPVTPSRVSVDPKSLQPGVLQGPIISVPEGEPLPTIPPAPSKPISDNVIQLEEGYVGETTEGLSNPVVNVPGLTSAADPPDTVGDVGRNHFVQMVNLTQFRIWDKKGNALTPALVFGNLWPVGDVCRSNFGDPIVVYDHLADRWLLSQFALPSHMCIAISQTPDPTTGMWFLYTFNVGVFPDYPKFGVWPDGYYMSSFEGFNLGVFVFQRDAMLVGQPASFMKTTISSLVPLPGVRETRILPSDLDGAPPPDGTPNFFVRTVANQQDVSNPTDRVEVYEAKVDWTIPSFTFTLVSTLIPEPFNVMVCNRNGSSPVNVRDCIPQPDTTSTVDALSNRPMMQLKYRNFGSFQAIVFNQTIDVRGSMPISAVEEVAGIRWYELHKFGADWTIRQQGTFAPQPSDATTENQLLHRWMGSAAMDKEGNIALGYSIVNDDDNNKVFPSIRYTGRYFDDPLGLLLEPERTILNGTNSETGGFGLRWGDYSALSVDPVDDCTFWYTNHVAGIGGTGPRPTRIASFGFASCAVLINDVVFFEPLSSTFQTTTDTSGCPVGFVGKFNFDARLTNNSSNSSLSNLAVKVATLTNGNLLQNADGGPAGVGASLTVPKTGSFSDGVLSPGEFVDVPLSICLKEENSFSFFVDVLGIQLSNLSDSVSK
jgi:hypothetical protein